ncbi:MAG: type II toxin-antitoxin system RelE/ParE family toxin [Selenomonadaceae bacterium]|nr:type II toxin-antitoxin system RelE/ParE family toxin [Selenomonadaceae bacterium]
MTYNIKTTARFDKELKKLDHYTQKIIKSWIVKNLVNTSNPREHGKGLTANLAELWRYRIGDYRIICEIQDDELIILALNIVHRNEIYKK